MSLRYNLEITEKGYYKFTTELGVEYVAFFSEYSIQDSHGNNHRVFSFGFERSGQYISSKFSYKYDYKIKSTIVFIIREFFKKHGNEALIYFCFQDDEYARHRSIAFSKWHREGLSGEIEHHRKHGVYNNEDIYMGILMLKVNPLRELILEAIDTYIDEIMASK